ncbi:MAG: hypothetical protein PG977_000183 [Bartonella clarridgeiae]|nr:MAG: hypothetical protein PG977_000183 [Bartonella clarridgeiae]
MRFLKLKDQVREQKEPRDCEKLLNAIERSSENQSPVHE